MGKLEKIENEVRALSIEELAAFHKWLREFDAEAWDREIEADAFAGKLDALADSIAELGPLFVRKRLGELPDLVDSLPRLSEVEAAEFAEDLASARSMLSSSREARTTRSWGST